MKGTSYEADFLKMQSRWEKNFGFNTKTPNVGKSSNVGYQNVSLQKVMNVGNPMTWQDAKKQSMGMI